MNASMFLRSASMQGAMLPLMSTTNTISATPFVFARACGAGAEAAGAATPSDASASAAWIGAIAAAVGEFDCVRRPIHSSGRPRRRRFAGPRRILRTLSATHASLHRLRQGRSRRRDNSHRGAKFHKKSAEYRSSRPPHHGLSFNADTAEAGPGAEGLRQTLLSEAGSPAFPSPGAGTSPRPQI